MGADVVGKRRVMAHVNKQFRMREINTGTDLELTNHAMQCRNDLRQRSSYIQKDKTDQQAYKNTYKKEQFRGQNQVYLEIKPSNMKTMSVDPLCCQNLIYI